MSRGVVCASLVEEGVQVAGAVSEPALIEKQLPLRPFLRLEAAGGVNCSLHEVEVATHDCVLGGVRGDSSAQVFNHLLLYRQLVLLRGEQTKVNEQERKVVTRERNKRHQTVTPEARR